MKRRLCISILTAAAFVHAPAARALPVKSGNELALAFVTAEVKEQRNLREEATGRVFFFRYLRVVGRESFTTNGFDAVRMSTIEPSSDMNVRFVVTKKVSLEKSADIGLQDGIAVTGRVKSLGRPENTIILNPVIVRYKDRLSPKAGRELLGEVEPDAVYFHYTGAGPDNDVFVRYKDKEILPWVDIQDQDERAAARRAFINKLGPDKFVEYLRKNIEERARAREAEKSSAETAAP